MVRFPIDIPLLLAADVNLDPPYRALCSIPDIGSSVIYRKGPMGPCVITEEGKSRTTDTTVLMMLILGPGGGLGS